MRNKKSLNSMIFLFLSGLLFLTCEKKEEYYYDAEYNYTIQIHYSGNKIVRYLIYSEENLLSKTEFSFEKNSVTQLRTDEEGNLIEKIIYKTDLKGLALSSIEIPEQKQEQTGVVFYTGHKYYEYDSQNHLVKESFGAIYENDTAHTIPYEYDGDTVLIPSNRYEYQNDDLTKSTPCLTPINVDMPSCIYTKYYPSDALNSVDYTNGIKGNPGRHLAKRSVSGENCDCTPFYSRTECDYSYQLDSLGYVTQRKEVRKYCDRHGNNTTSTTTTNYKYVLYFN